MKKSIWHIGVLALLAFFLVLGKDSVVRVFAFDEVGIRYDCGDRTFFHSDYISDRNDSYQNCLAVNNGQAVGKNRIVFHRCGENRYLPNRTDSTIYFMKNSRYDCYLDVTGLNTKVFSYYTVRGKVKSDQIGAEVKLASFKARIDQAYVTMHTLGISADGYFTAADGTQLKKETAGQWTDYAVAFDFVRHTADIYLDGRCVHTLSIDERAAKPEVFRFWLYHDNKDRDPIDGIKNGDVYFDELEVTGSVKPYRGDESNYTSVLYDDTPIETYLQDKIVYATDDGGVFSHGQKSHPDMILYYDAERDELYGDVRALNAGFDLGATQDENAIKGATITVKDSGMVICQGRALYLNQPILYRGTTMLLPIKEIAQRAMQKYAFQDGYGIFIFSDTAVNLDLASEQPEYVSPLKIPYQHSEIKSIRRYMAFDRPSAATLRADYEKKNLGHPRIMADRATFDMIRSEVNRNGSYIKKAWESIKTRADSYAAKAPLSYNIPDKQRILDISREMVTRMEYIGFAYQVTKNQVYADAAWKNVEAVIHYPDWNPSHMIDVGEMNYAVALAYDWCYDGFTEAQRQQIWEGIKRHGLSVTRLCYYGRVPHWPQWANYTDAFVQWKSNFNAVINGGALAAAIAFADREPDFCFDIVEKSVRSLEYTMIGFEPAGTWIEGTGYWDYTMQYLAKGVGSLMLNMGSDYGLMHYRGVQDSALWYRSMYSFEGNNNFHDSGAGDTSYAYFPWLGKIYDDPRLSATRRAAVKRGHAYTIFDAIWYQSGISSTESGYPAYSTFEGIESVTDRASLTDASAMYFSAHGGQVFCYHSQADAGSFIFDALGERWAADLGAEDYNVQRDGGLGYYGSYRRRAEAHNVVVINPNTDDQDGGQEDDAYVELIKGEETDCGSVTEYDMTPAYDEVNLYRRQFQTDRENQSLVITDLMELKEESTVCWFMTTAASVTWTDDTHFVLTKNGKKMYGKIEVGDGALHSETTACEPYLGAPYLEGQNTNAGYQRVVVSVRASGLLRIRVTLSPKADYTARSNPNVTDYMITKAALSQNGTAVTEQCTSGEIEAVYRGYNFGAAAPILSMAQYNRDGMLIGYQQSRAEEKQNQTELTVNLSVQDEEGSYVKVYLWDEAQRPMAAVKTLYLTP